MTIPETERSDKTDPAETAKGAKTSAGAQPKPDKPQQAVDEIGGRDGPDPTRYGDYEKDGRCVDF